MLHDKLIFVVFKELINCTYDRGVGFKISKETLTQFIVFVSLSKCP